MAKIKGIQTKVGDSTSAVTKSTVDATSSGSGSIATGVISMLATDTVPSGWMLCDGSQYSQTTYAALYAVIGNAYNTHPTLGVASSGNFRVPDFRDLFPVGSGNTMSSRQNLVTYSEQFNNAAWGKYGLTVTSNSTTSPIGDTTADTITESSVNPAGNLHGFYASSAISIVIGQSYIFSVYLKPNGRDIINIYPDAVAGKLGAPTKVNITTGTVVTNGGATNVSITNEGNGWFRIAITCTATGTAASPGVYLTDGTNEAYSPNGTSGAYVWGAQFVSASTFPQNTYQRIAAANDYSTGSNAEYNTTGWNHTHTVPTHAHTLGNHTHTLNAHTHTIASHAHTLGSHTHSVGAHTHNILGHIHYFGAHRHSNALSVSTSHYHNITIYNTGTTGTGNPRGAVTSGTTTIGTTAGSFTVSLSGTVGSTYLADSGHNTDWYSLNETVATGSSSSTTGTTASNSGVSGIVTTGASSATSGTPSSNTTSSDGATATDAANPPYFGVHFIIKS